MYILQIRLIRKHGHYSNIFRTRSKQYDNDENKYIYIYELMWHIILTLSGNCNIPPRHCVGIVSKLYVLFGSWPNSAWAWVVLTYTLLQLFLNSRSQGSESWQCKCLWLHLYLTWWVSTIDKQFTSCPMVKWMQTASKHRCISYPNIIVNYCAYFRHCLHILANACHSCCTHQGALITCVKHI
jgi:hypothetical protein